VLPDLDSVIENVTLSNTPWVGIPLALVGAVLLSLGAHYQHKGVIKVETNSGVSADAGLTMSQLSALVRRPSWVTGTVLLGIAVLFQLAALSVSTLTAVQPLGALALVVTAVLSARASGIKLDAVSIRAIAFCIGGVALFVTIASVTTRAHPITSVQLTAVLVILGVVLAVAGVLFAIYRKRMSALYYIIAAGVLFGFVATLAKVIIGRVQTLFNVQFQTGQIEWLTILCLVGLIAAAALGSYFVQSAYASGPPDLVVAGLTVIDPIIAVAIAIIVLGEAATAPLWAMIAFVVAGSIAVYGVFQLAKHHPQAQR